MDCFVLFKEHFAMKNQMYLPATSTGTDDDIFVSVEINSSCKRAERCKLSEDLENTHVDIKD